MKQIQPDLSQLEYRAHTDYMSASDLKLVKRSPMHLDKREEKESDALNFGRALHEFVLQPELFKQTHILYDEAMRPEQDKGITSKLNQQWKQGMYQLAHDKDLSIINKGQLQMVEDMKAHLMSHFYARHLLTKGTPEASFFSELDGVKVKCRPDNWAVNAKTGKNVIIELKTITDASEDKFKRDLVTYNYHLSLAFYIDIVEKVTGKPSDYIFIVIEKEPPYGFNIFRPSDQMIACGRYEYEVLLNLYKQCREAESFPGYGVWTDNNYDVKEIDLPVYAIREINHKQIK